MDFEQKYLSTNHPSLFVLTLTVMAHSECVRIIHTNVRYKHTISCWLDLSEGEIQALQQQLANLLEEVEYNYKALIKRKPHLNVASHRGCCQ